MYAKFSKCGAFSFGPRRSVPLSPLVPECSSPGLLSNILLNSLFIKRLSPSRVFLPAIPPMPIFPDSPVSMQIHDETFYNFNHYLISSMIIYRFYEEFYIWMVHS